MKSIGLVTLAIIACSVQAIPRKKSQDQIDWDKVDLSLSLYKSVQPTVQPRREGNSYADVCGKLSREIDSKIVGGEEAKPHSWGWAVALFLGNRFFCGGSLITERHVLTAAHCAEISNNINIHIGGHKLGQVEDGKVIARSQKIKIHDGWDRYSLSNDIAIITLDTNVTFTDSIRPACIPSYSDIKTDLADKRARPIGWGVTSDDSNTASPVLREVSVPVLSNSQCNKTYQVIQSSHVCTDSKGGKGVCFGDSGGSLNYQREDGKYIQIGVNSFVSSSGCESEYPHGYTRVTSFLEFISENAGIKIED